MKRFQECNLFEKIWRYRFYVELPFLYLFYQKFKPFKVYIDQCNGNEVNKTDNYEIIRGNVLWKNLIGLAQIKMNWTYTAEEVFEKLKFK